MWPRPAASVSGRVPAVVGGAGLLAVVGSMLWLPPAPHPWMLAIACLGTAAIVRAGSIATTATTRALSLRPVVAVGLVSYSLYLCTAAARAGMRAVHRRHPGPVTAGILAGAGLLRG